MRLNYLLKSRFEGHFSAFPQRQFENIRRRFSGVSHIAQSKLCMRLASLYGGIRRGGHAFARCWRSVGRNPWREHDDSQKEHVTVWTIFPTSSRYWPHNMREALFPGVWGGSPGLYGRGKQCFLFRFCALALVGAGQDFRGALRMRKGNPPGTASGRRARDYQKCNRDVSRNLPHRGCDGS
jgi:hypothetical protein